MGYVEEALANCYTPKKKKRISDKMRLNWLLKYNIFISPDHDNCYYAYEDRKSIDFSIRSERKVK